MASKRCSICASVHLSSCSFPCTLCHPASATLASLLSVQCATHYSLHWLFSLPKVLFPLSGNLFCQIAACIIFSSLINYLRERAALTTPFKSTTCSKSKSLRWMYSWHLQRISGKLCGCRRIKMPNMLTFVFSW